MSILLAVFLGVVVIILAILAIYHSNLKIAIIATGVVGLFSSIIYLLLAAPDVAMTEASIGSGLTTIIFFYVLNKIRKSNG
ncbi:MAG TPA: DUF4040 domain-containing protein [Tenuifilaceae bacterium]|nr:DUF4040 domain-containing protein [Tenuifilaceae bacterium]HPE17916.1 DUF4040 domain-containing protein [Tenuifilaceae bacterium]HPJ45411.1 DUF4040 domain-containing protein [Tenuifilaceae bacterium]HPQ33208.1 DUF4040 domain-containing protein [Tenuifilaceae bacterium]